MASASNLSTSAPAAAATTSTTAAITSRPFAAISASAKSPARPQTPQPPSFPIYHLYPPSQNIAIRPTPQQAQTPNQITNPTPSQQHQQGIIYPVASSGRGFMPRPVPIVNTPNLSHPRGAGIPYRPAYPNHNHNPVHMMRQHPTQLQHHHQPQHFINGAALAPIKGIPVTGPLKAALSSPLPVSDSNGYKSTRDKSRDDNIMVIRDRKVKLSGGVSVYALCRSWLRNGLSEENQPHYGDFIKVLPRPLPESDVDTQSPKKEGEKIEDNEDEESVSHLSTQDLLLRHIKRAKWVRARLREGRLKRIARYKTRLAMLLPPQVEQLRNETAPGN